jgi:3-oxoadipate enol-lactonase
MVSSGGRECVRTIGTGWAGRCAARDGRSHVVSIIADLVQAVPSRALSSERPSLKILPSAALLRALDFGPCLVMGVSFGGMVAQELACRYPNLVQRLVLACTSAGGEAGASYPLHELQNREPRARGIRATEIADTRYGASWREANPEDAEKLIELAIARAQPRDEEAVRGPRLQLEARSHHDTVDRLAKITTPVYVCAGQYDGIAPPDNQHALVAALPNASLEFFEGGHLFLIQDRSAFTRIMKLLNE